MNELALFAGAGGGILGGHLLGWRTVCAVEIDLFCRQLLVRRQNEGILPPFPIWDDIRTFDGKPWRGIVDVVSGGFPCQDISCAGKGAGITGERSGLWSEMARVVREVGPRFVFVENSPMLTLRGLDTVLGDLAAMGFDAEWCVLGADDCGAPHRRKRIWILAHAQCVGFNNPKNFEILEGQGKDQFCPFEPRNTGHVGHSFGAGLEIREGEEGFRERQAVKRTGDVADAAECESDRRRDRIGWWSGFPGNDPRRSERNSWWESEPRLGRVAHGVAHRVDRLRAIGNGQVPIVAATAFRILRELIEREDEK